MAERVMQIALFLPPTPGYLSDVYKGIQEYARTAGSWCVEVCSSLAIAENAMRTWRPDGIFVNAMDGDWDPLIASLKIPTVQIGGKVISNTPQIQIDNDAIGKLAAKYLADRGFRQFAYVGYDYIEWSVHRGNAFEAALAARGLECKFFWGKFGAIQPSEVTGKLATFVRNLPKPAAIFACQDRAAMLIGHACTHAGIEVPEELVILGVDNNPFECGFTHPPISSIMGSGRRIGYQAAGLLHEMIDGRKNVPDRVLVEPAGVETRASTDIVAVDDPDVAAALKFIDQNAGEPILVKDVARAAFASRRMLERKFTALLQQSPRERILRAHIEQAKRLLIQGN